MSINSITKDKFKYAILKLKKSKLLKIFVLSSILLSRGKLNCDLIAEENYHPSIETIIPNSGINITCNDSDEHLAKKFKQILLDFEDDNETANILIKSLEKNNTIFEIDKESDLYAGSYIIGENKIIIPRNTIETIFEKGNSIDILRLKRAIAHETIHMLQDKKGVFQDAKQMSPLDCSIVYTITELDAICKSYIATEIDFWDTNSAFDCLKNMTPSLENYTIQGFFVSKACNKKASNLLLKDTIKKLNNEGFDDYEDIDEIIDTIKEKIRPEIIEEITCYTNSNAENIETQQIITQRKIEKE